MNKLLLICLLPNLIWADWVLTSQHPNFPKSSYWTGVGVASTQKKARELASTEIAKQFKMQISYRNRDTQVETKDIQGKMSDSEFYYSKTQINTSIEIDNIEFALSKEVKEGVAVLAVVNKEKYLLAQQVKLLDFIADIKNSKKTFLNDKSLNAVWLFEKHFDKVKREYQKGVRNLSRLGFATQHLSWELQLPSIDRDIEAHRTSILRTYDLGQVVVQDSNDITISPNGISHMDSIRVWCMDRTGENLKSFSIPNKMLDQVILLKSSCYGAYNILVGHSRSYLTAKMEKWVKSNEVNWKVPSSWKYYSTLTISDSLKTWVAKDKIAEILKAKGYVQTENAPALNIEGKVRVKTIRSFDQVRTYYSANIYLNFKGWLVDSQLKVSGAPVEVPRGQVIPQVLEQKL